VANNQIIHVTHTPFVDVQIRPTDGRGGDAHQDISRALYTRVLDGLDGDIPLAAPYHRFHRAISSFLLSTVKQMMLWMLLMQFLIWVMNMFLLTALMPMTMEVKTKAIVQVLMAVLPLTMMNVQRGRFFCRQRYL
jgi:hypothetical protein